MFSRLAAVTVYFEVLNTVLTLFKLKNNEIRTMFLDVLFVPFLLS